MSAQNAEDLFGKYAKVPKNIQAVIDHAESLGKKVDVFYKEISGFATPASIRVSK